MASEEKKYVCIREKQIGKHESEITELKVRADYKDQKIDELNSFVHSLDKKIDEKMHDMDEKLDKITDSIEDLRMQSVQDDFNIDKRVKSLESKLETLKWVVGASVSILAVLVSILALVITHIH